MVCSPETVTVPTLGSDSDAVTSPRMSALGQKQTLEHASRMSALPPKADILRGGLDVR